jgi:hypothetical protein
MECDHLKEALRFMRSALRLEAESRYDIERAIEHVEATEKQMTILTEKEVATLTEKWKRLYTGIIWRL